MAKNLTIAGVNYPSVPGLSIPVQGGGSAYFPDTSGDTVTAAHLEQGYTAHDAQGNPVTGTLQPGGGDDRPTFTAVYDENWDLTSFTCDWTYAECVDFVLNDGSCGWLVSQDIEGTYKQPAIPDLDDWDNPTEIIWRTVFTNAFPGYEFHYSANELTDPENADAYERPTLTENGVYYPEYGKVYDMVTVAVSGGGGIGTLLNTTTIGTVNTTSTQSSSLNVSCSVSGINNYDLLIVESSVNTVTNGRHSATIALIFLTAGTSIGTKNGASVINAKVNMKVSSNGTTTSSSSTTSYGIYPNSCTVSNGTATIPMYRRYNSTSTGTINGTYTTRVYGVNLYDLIGG